MTIIEALLSRTKDGKKELARQSLIVDTTEKIWAVMEDEGVTKSDLARILETSKSNVTQLLNGQRNMTLSSLSDICEALQVKPIITFLNIKPSVTVDVFSGIDKNKLLSESGKFSFVISSGVASAPSGRVTASNNVTVWFPKVAQSLEA